MREVFEVVTPENVPFEFELAGVATRAAAYVIDLGVMMMVLMAASAALGLFGVLSDGLARALYFIAGFVTQWGYGTLLEWLWRGQTIGKRLTHIRVLGSNGMQISFAQALIRNLVRVVDMLPLLHLAGGITALVDRSGRRLGDLAAGTVVARERARPRPALISAPSERYNSFLHDPAVIHAARRINAPEREVMVGLSLRRERLPLGVRHRLFERLARHLETRLGIARPAFFSHEKFVLHLTTVVLSVGREAIARTTPVGAESTAVAP